MKALSVFIGVCLLAACTCFLEATRSSTGPHLVPAHASPIPVAQTTPVQVTTPLPASVAPPVLVQIPAVGLSAPVVPVGLNPQHQIVMPSTSVAGWYRLGPSPGAIGPALIVGHVDSYRGPAVFYRLTAVRAGEDVVVVRADGSRSEFVISAVTVVAKAAFPTSAVFAPTSTPTLRLITCTGPFDPTSRHYVDSLIVWGVAL